MYDWETPFLIMLVVAMSPLVVILITVILAIFCLIVDAVAFAVLSFIHDVRLNSNSKEN